MAKRNQSLAGRVAAVEKAVARFFTGKRKKARKVAKKSKRSKALAARKAKTKTKSNRKSSPKRAKKSVVPRAARKSKRRPTATVPTPDQLAPSGEPNFVTPTDTL
jgi:hypothetical protein